VVLTELTRSKEQSNEEQDYEEAAFCPDCEQLTRQHVPLKDRYGSEWYCQCGNVFWSEDASEILTYAPEDSQI